MRKLIISLLFAMWMHTAFSQSISEYKRLVSAADSLYKLGSFKKSADTYSSAFRAIGWKGFIDDRYHAARAWAKANVADSAFYNLEKITSKGIFKDYARLSSDADLKSLHDDKRWALLLEKVKSSRDKSESITQSPVYILLDSMERADEKWRSFLEQVAKSKQNAATADSLRRKIMVADSLNYFRLQEVFEKYGYPDYDLAGEKGSHNFWSLVQRQDKHPSFQESAVTQMKEKADKGKASIAEYAFLKDHVLVNAGKPQIYGTQLQLNGTGSSYEAKPVEDIANLNERRKSVGLSTEEDYMTMNMRYFRKQ